MLFELCSMFRVGDILFERSLTCEATWGECCWVVARSNGVCNILCACEWNVNIRIVCMSSHVTFVLIYS